MNKNYRKSLAMCLAFLMLLVSGHASAALLNPDRALLADDVGVEIFSPLELAASVELFDPLDALTSMGFYYVDTDATSAANRITLFDSLDQGQPNSPGPIQIALIDFVNGDVVDFDNGAVQNLQDTFTPRNANVGFYLDVGGTLLFTQAALNPNGLDLSATFTSLLDPFAHVIGFESSTGDILSFNIVAGFAAVPLPPALLLMFSALPIFGLLGIKRRKRVA